MNLLDMKSAWLKVKALSRLKKILISIFLMMSFVIALLSCLMVTQTGSHWVVRKLADIAQVELGDVKGNLLTGLDIDRLDYQKDKLSLHAEKISFRWQPLGLFYTAVAVQSLSAENIRVHLPPSKKEPEPENYQWPSLAQPVRIQLEKINVRNIEIRQGETLIPISQIKGDLSLGTFHLRSNDLTFENAQAKLIVNGAMGLRYPYEFDVKAKWQFSDKTQTAENYSGTAVLTGDIKTLKLQHELLQPMNIKSNATISPALHQPKGAPSATITLDWAEQALLPAWADYLKLNQPLELVKSVSTTQGHVEMVGWFNAFKVTSNIHALSADKQFLLSSNSQGGYDADKKLLNNHIDKLSLLIKSKDAADTAQNLFDVTGDINGFHAWQWNLNLRTENFNLGDVIDDWPSNLNFSLSAQGEFSPSTPATPSQLKLAFKNINGQGDLRGLAVSANGELSFDGERWTSPNANLAIGANQLMLKGQAGNALALEWKINAPLLGQIDPSLRGSIISSGLISGDKAKPRLQVTAQVDQFAWRDYGIQKLQLTLKPQAANDNYNLNLDASHLQLQQNSISRIAINGSGTLTQHTIDGVLESPSLGNLKLKLNSSWKDQIWRGQWREFTLNMKKVPTWTLSSASPMQIDMKQTKNSMDLGKFCLTTQARFIDKESALKLTNLPHTNAKSLAQRIADATSQVTVVAAQELPLLCVASNWSSTAGLASTINLTAVPINQAQAWFKPEVALKGVVDGNIAVTMPRAKPLAVDAHVQTRDAQLLYQFQGGKIEIYSLQKGVVDVTVKGNQLNAKLLMDWARYGAINADAKYDLTDKKIQGKLSAALTDLAPLEGLLPFLNDVQGSANATVNLTGTADKPELSGNITLANGGANLPKLGLVLKNVSLQVTSPSPRVLHTEAQITSGDGTLMIKGEFANAGTPEWNWQGNIFGANIRFIDQPQMKATVSPNLKLSANASAFNLTGSTEIPWSRTLLKTLPASATRVSSDVTVIENDNESYNSISSKKSIPFFTNVILYFGDDVRFKGFGLDSQLLGKVNVLKEEQRQTLVTGFVGVGKGNYKAYGQDLVIERGRLIFQGPYDNPGLDIRAVRILDSGSAGLEIGGTLQHPKSSVFSIPASTDSEAMAMLLTGKALSQSSQADAYSLIGAIGSLGMDNGQMMTSDIAHLFRIDEITIKSDKGLEQSALWMGKQVTPKLFIRYMVGLFDQAFSLGMSYQLNDKLKLEAESGKNQSLDVIYKIER